MTELIPLGNGSANSADFTLAEGDMTTISMTAPGGNIPGNTAVYVQKKSGSDYVTIGQIDSNTPAKNLTAIGTYRVYRDPGGLFAVERD